MEPGQPHPPDLTARKRRVVEPDGGSLVSNLYLRPVPPRGTGFLPRASMTKTMPNMLPSLEDAWTGVRPSKRRTGAYHVGKSQKIDVVLGAPAATETKKTLPPMDGTVISALGTPLRGTSSAMMRSGSRLTTGGSEADAWAEGTTYIGLMYTLRQYPNSDEFVYLKRLDAESTVYNPYALDVVPFSQVDPNDFYTMSVRGLTHYVDGGNADFTTLEQWEREFQLFNAMSVLKVFKLFRIWKGFTLWKRGVRQTKVNRAKAALQKDLFQLNSVFQPSLMRVRQLCHGISVQRLHSLHPGTLYTLEKFWNEQETQRSIVRAALEEFGAATLDAVSSACGQALEQLEDRLMELSSKNGGDAEAPHGMPTPRTGKSAGAAVLRDGGENYSYTIAAARRSEQRKLLCFVKLADYMICDTLHDLLVESMSDIFNAVQPGEIPDEAAILEEERAMAAAAEDAEAAEEAEALARGEGPESPVRGGGPGEEGEEEEEVIERPPGPIFEDTEEGMYRAERLKPQPPATGAVFEVEVLPTASGTDLEFSPSADDLQLKMDEIVSGFIDTLCTVTRLLSQKDLMEKVVEGGEVEMSNSLADLIDDEKHQGLVSSVKESMSIAFEAVEDYKLIFEPFTRMVRGNDTLEISDMSEEYAENVRTLEDFRRDMEVFHLQKERIEALPSHADVGVIKINAVRLKDLYLPSPIQCLDTLAVMLPKMAADMYTEFSAEINEASSKLLAPLNTVEDFVDKLSFYQEVLSSLGGMDKRGIEIQNIYDLIEVFKIPVADMELAAFQTLTPDFNSMKSAMDEVEATRDENVTRFTTDLEKGCEEIAKEVVDIRNAATQNEMILDDKSNHDEVIKYCNELKDRVTKQEEEAARIRRHQTLFKVQETRFPDLEEAKEDVDLKLAMWQGEKDWGAMTAEWSKQLFDDIDADDMEEKVQRFSKLCFKLEKGVPKNGIVPRFSEAVTLFKNVLPVIQSLRNKALKERHWGKINEVLGIELVRDETFTLKRLFDIRAFDFKDEISLISTEATQELALEELLAKVVNKWADVEFMVLSYKESKDTFILGGVEDVQVALEDSMVTMTTILASRFVSGIRTEVEKVEKSLNLFSETLDEWLSVQKNWMYLESIFSAPDIQRQLPTEAKAFFAVDKQFRDILRRCKENPNALKAGTTPGYLDTFQKSNDTLDRIQKNLEDYLETKRMAFPRFYFLSNDELLEILAQTKNVQAVQPHMSKCFDGIKSLDFGSDPKSINIFAMISGEGENVPLGNNLKARGNVEQWLTAVEQAMAASLQKLAKQGFQSYPEEQRVEWVKKQPAQLVIVISQVYWCQSITDILSSDDPLGGMKDFYGVNVDVLKDMTMLVRGDLSSLHRKSIVALITIDVHARDIVEMLLSTGVKNVNEFGWQMQLRYTWDDVNDLCQVRQTNAVFNYAYEYLGAQSRLVVTPMTDRCYMTLTGALHLKLGGAPAGPAGTGKTETTKDLGKALGVQCVVFNCGDNLDYKFMGKFFSGLAQCGAWACFDEFNRIDIEVLSVVAQQLLTIQNALKAGVTKFNFEGRDIKLIATCGVFITMNPGYAGRTELPDNLKALFRPMSMMIPDYALVAEVMLFAEGFETSKVLSKKMVKLYKLSSEQLSQQDHYDFGMRALKSVLVMAGSLKRANMDLPEDVVLIRAMKDSNLPKFLIEDAELFLAIVQDLFPGVEVPAQDSGDLAKAISQCIRAKGLQSINKFVTKIVQLYETFNVRFGVMLVGPTGGGKTTCYQMLQDAQTMLFEQKHPDESFQKTHTYVFNPKCIKMGELYGEYNLLTNEWTDGLGSTLIRNAVADTTMERKWVVFDGPVDAIWIENMNTVLDDNCTLCLPNGERIKLNPNTMRMLFEVQDLAVASPATVSRCGMVYVPPDELGWKPYVITWANNRLNPSMREEAREYVRDLFDLFVDKGIKWVRKYGKENIPSVDINLVTSLSFLLQSLLSQKHNFDYTRPMDEVRPVVGKIFAFAFVWSIGGNLDSDNHEAFDEFVREMFGSQTINFPSSGTVFDYGVDLKEGQFKNWEGMVDKFQYDATLPYFQLLVPNVDTTRFSFLLKTLIEVDKSVLFTGVTGVGKSVIAVNAMERYREELQLVPLTINFSAQTPALDTQVLIESKLEKKRKTKFGAPVGKKMVIFIDDVNMPAKETYGAQPPVELLRQFQDFRGFYDRQKLFWKDVEDTTLLAACAPPGGGRQEVTPRFFRHFNMLCVPPPSDGSMRTILGEILQGFLGEGFNPDFKSLVDPIVNSSVEVYRRICEELLPTPAKSHYTFNLRDLSKVLQGVLMIRPDNCTEKPVMTRLWVHESMRVFHDRLINDEDKTYFKTMLCEVMTKNFGGEAPGFADLFEERNIIFGDFNKMGAEPEDRVYEEVPDFSKMVKLMEDYLEEYNFSSTNAMKLVFFKDAAEHATRMARILRQPRGNAMLVGVGGSGKQSLTRFASFMASYQCIQIELTRGYGSNEFREDLKTLYKTAGIDGASIVFLFTDTQIVNEGFLEDINNLLNSGEVPGLFPQDEKDRMINDIRPYCQENGIPETKDSMYAAFINRVRDNLHIVLAMSPVGEAFRARCRQFPSLINCCTIDWYTEWPREALLSVSERFLTALPEVSDEVKEGLSLMCVDIHMSVTNMSDRFWDELRRKFYTTPKSYLDLINLYVSLIAEKREEFGTARDRLLNGLTKLAETNEVVDSMKKELGELQPILEEKSKATAELLIKVTKDQEEAEQVAKRVGVDEAEVKAQAEETKIIADDAKADLDEAMPALQAAVDSLNALNKGDITEIKSFPKPPPLVALTMEAVCVLLGEKTDWDTAKKVLSNNDFLKNLKEYDKDNIPERTIKQLKKYIETPEYTPEQVARQSKAAMSLCMWTRAMDVYSRVAKVVEPKRQALAKAEATLEEANASLKQKQDELQAVQDQVAALKQQLEDAQNEQLSLQEQAGVTEKRLVRAGKLTSGLSDEAVRWQETADSIGEMTALLVGDVFLSSACIAYYGAFTGEYRNELVASWIARCKELGIPVSDDCSLRKTLASPVEVREWNIWGLPTDNVSIDNGILVTRGKRWPLMIDPQGQANSWVKAMEAKNGLRCIKLTDGNFLRTLENSIRIGNPVLVEDVGEHLDPALEPVLQKQTFQVGGRTLIRLGDSDVDYDPGFKFYLTTKMPNPHYLPEVCIKVTMINFTVTMKGLEDQLLGDVVRKEQPELEEKKDRLVVSISNDKKQLKDLEDKILKLLKESEGNILDDEVLINTLNNSKLTSGMIEGRVKDAEATELEINEAREGYRPAAIRGSILYFVIADLALINPMYQYSLAYFTRLFNTCIDQSEKHDEVEERLKILSEYVTLYMYTNVCRGLFEEHKLLYSFLMCTAILRARGDIGGADWNFLLRGAVGINTGGPENPDPDMVTDPQWVSIVFLDGMSEAFKGIAASFASPEGRAEWGKWIQCEAPEATPLPMEWAERLDSFQRLLVLKVLREDKLVFGWTEYVAEKSGPEFTEAPPWNLDDVFPDTTARIPVTFVLSTGADPTQTLQRFATKVGWVPGERLHMISLGQGQGPVAEMLVMQAMKSGDWVFLQNCHLAKSWMLSLERMVEELGQDKTSVHDDFRLWLSSMPAAHFPVLVLQNSIKLTNEPPKGVKANIRRTYNDMNEEFFESCTKPAPWKKLLFSLAFYHAVLQERRKFGPLGWNIRYEFNTSDIECSMMTLKMFLEEQPIIPWESLSYVIGQINYGGRVTDDLDRRCLMSILNKYYSPRVLLDEYKYTPSGTYYAPPEGDLASYRDYISNLPVTEAPEVFGMHQNAQITFQMQETRKNMDTLLAIQPRVNTSDGGKSPDETVAELAAGLEVSLQPLLDAEEAAEGLFDRTDTGQLKSLSVVLSQEMERFNRLTSVLRSSLVDLQKAIKGLVVMSGELEMMYTSLLNNQVPGVWESVAYPSLKPLASWMKDYHERITFMRLWLTEGAPKCFWMPGFFFPQGFMTGVLQAHARKYSIPIDSLSFSFSVTDWWDVEEVDAPPEDGVLINGLYIDGARWDEDRMVLEESDPGKMFSNMKVVHFNPALDYSTAEGLYQCPLYKTSVRAGILSTTGASTNFVLCVDLPIREGTDSDFWVLEGVALLCALNT